MIHLPNNPYPYMLWYAFSAQRVASAPFIKMNGVRKIHDYLSLDRVMKSAVSPSPILADRRNTSWKTIAGQEFKECVKSWSDGSIETLSPVFKGIEFLFGIDLPEVFAADKPYYRNDIWVPSGKNKAFVLKNNGLLPNSLYRSQSVLWVLCLPISIIIDFPVFIGSCLLLNTNAPKDIYFKTYAYAEVISDLPAVVLSTIFTCAISIPFFYLSSLIGASLKAAIIVPGCLVGILVGSFQVAQVAATALRNSGL